MNSPLSPIFLVKGSTVCVAVVHPSLSYISLLGSIPSKSLLMSSGNDCKSGIRAGLLEKRLKGVIAAEDMPNGPCPKKSSWNDLMKWSCIRLRCEGKGPNIDIGGNAEKPENAEKGCGGDGRKGCHDDKWVFCGAESCVCLECSGLELMLSGYAVRMEKCNAEDMNSVCHSKNAVGQANVQCMRVKDCNKGPSRTFCETPAETIYSLGSASVWRVCVDFSAPAFLHSAKDL